MQFHAAIDFHHAGPAEENQHEDRPLQLPPRPTAEKPAGFYPLGKPGVRPPRWARREAQSWAPFFNFFTDKKWFFALFIKLIWLGVGFLNSTGAEIG